MAKKKAAAGVTERKVAPIHPQLITDTIEKNYMPYVMSVIISRAIPEIDGFKPAHRKLLYTMLKMGLMNGKRTKSANVTGATMQLNPHGTDAIYDTLVRLSRDYEALLHPFVDSKGNFGKYYSGDPAAAARYTEVKLESFCSEIFSGIDKDAVEFVDNYDSTMKEPVLLPTTFPNILVTPNKGIAVGMASDICSFNLSEICDATIAMLKKPNTTVDRLLEIIKAPDFPCGGFIIYDEEQFRNIYSTGQGSFRIRSRYTYDKSANCIDITQIPYTTTTDQIINKIAALVKEGKLKEITDFRDESELSGLKLTLDLRRGVDPDKLMLRLFKTTTLEDSFKCNFNILINSSPRTMGIPEILKEWIDFRMSCVRREFTFDLKKKNDKLHLLMGLAKILLDIDKAIKIIRRTEKEEDVIPNLMEGFSIDEIQAEYIAEIKLRYLNRQYILNRISEIEDLKREIAEIEDILSDELKIKAYIANQLSDIKKKYGKPRKTQIMHAGTVEHFVEDTKVESYPVRIILSNDGYFKKITMKSLMGNDEQKFKEGDFMRQTFEADNADSIMFFTNSCQVYRAKIDDFDNTKASLMGDYIPSKLGMDQGEKPLFMKICNEFKSDDNMVFIFENGKGVRVPFTAYEVKGNRRKLTGAYSSTSPIVGILEDTNKEPREIMLVSSDQKAISFKTSLIPQKTTRSSQGVQLMTLKKSQTIIEVKTDFNESTGDKSFRKIKLPASGISIK